jgi:hypothetical protein
VTSGYRRDATAHWNAARDAGKAMATPLAFGALVSGDVVGRQTRLGRFHKLSTGDKWFGLRESKVLEMSSVG